jgi:hypothetical protein
VGDQQQQNHDARARRLALEQQRRVAAVRRRRAGRGAAAIAAVLVLAAGIALASTTGGGGAPSPLGPEGVPVPAGPELAAPAAPTDGHTVDGISCLAGEQLAFHIHAHLTLFMDGASRHIPGGVGIIAPQATRTSDGPFVSGGSCFYWLHTHAPDGIIHIESPIRRTYTLGDFFDIWGEQLGPNQVGTLRGPVVVFYNGLRYRSDPREVPLTAHAQIQLEIGRPVVAPARITFPPGL